MKKTILALSLTAISLMATMTRNDTTSTVTDSGTGLMWQDNTDISYKNWVDSVAYCENLILGGYSDWRMPDVNELLTITDDSRHTAINVAFKNISVASRYWSSYPGAAGTGNAWAVSFVDGDFYHSDGTDGFYVRCTRGGTSRIDAPPAVTTTNTPPVANFTPSTTSGTAPLTISFTDGSTNSYGYITSWLWDFGDGTISTVQNPSKTFSQAGTYIVKCTVTNSSGTASTKTTYITISAPAVATTLQTSTPSTKYLANGWNLFGSTESLDPTTSFGSSCIKSVYGYNALKSQYITYKENSLIQTTTATDTGAGFWVQTPSAGCSMGFVTGATGASSTPALPETIQTCQDTTYAQANPCKCNATYANANPAQCGISTSTIVGAWTEHGVNQSGTSSIDGVQTFYSNGTFSNDMAYGSSSDPYRFVASGTWSYGASASQLAYHYTGNTSYYKSGKTVTCASTASSWPAYTCDDGTTNNYTSGSGAVSGNANKFSILQDNSWTMTYTRK